MHFLWSLYQLILSFLFYPLWKYWMDYFKKYKNRINIDVGEKNRGICREEKHKGKPFFLMLGLVLLAGCTTQPEWLQKKRYYPDWQFSATEVNHYSFEWEMDGDKAVLPELVFSTQSEIWMRFRPNQEIPVILGIDTKNQREKVLKVHYSPPYVVLKAPYATLQLHGITGGRGRIWHTP